MRGWSRQELLDAPGSSENWPPHESRMGNRRNLWRGPPSGGDVRSSRRSRPVIGSNRALIFSIKFLTEMQQDLGLYWWELGHLCFMYTFSSILDHADRDLQLSNTDLDKLFAGDKRFADCRMSYPRFVLLRTAYTRYFDPTVTVDGEVPSWYDPLFTPVSYEEYSYMTDAKKKKHGPPLTRKCLWYDFRLTIL